ncbi:NAD(P)-binding protein [Meredithblackwellia eburnea MCA 4105]
MPKPGEIVRVGIVGTGEIAQVTHLPTLTFMSDKFKVVALCDASKKSLEHSATKYNIQRTYTEFSDLAKDPEVDLIMILAANAYHAAFAIEAADNGKAVFIEKPMALTHADCKAIIDAQERNQVTIFIGYMRRYAPAFMAAKEIVSQMKNISYVRVRDIIGSNAFFVSQSGTFPQKFDDFPAEAIEDMKVRNEAISKEALGEKANNSRDVFLYNVLGGLGSHDLSAMREMLGGTPKSCFAATRAPTGFFISALLEYDGFTVCYESGSDQVIKFDAHIEVYGDNKRVKVTYDSPYVKGLPITTTVLETDEKGQYVEKVIRPTYEDAFTVELKELYRCITEKAMPKTSPTDAAEELKIFDMIMAALKN